jgi:hypothetical protein
MQAELRIENIELKMKVFFKLPFKKGNPSCEIDIFSFFSACNYTVKRIIELEFSTFLLIGQMAI